jgi:hypothetical protein
MIKTVLIGLLLGATLGVSLAAEVFQRIGMQAETYMIIIGGMLIATLVINRGIGVLAAFVALSMAVMQPEQVLLEYGFDRDYLLAALMTTVMFPVVQRVIQS